jgi:hypothetical protein
MKPLRNHCIVLVLLSALIVHSAAPDDTGLKGRFDGKAHDPSKFAGAAAFGPANGEAPLRLIPFPKEVRMQSGLFSLAGPLVLEMSEAQSETGLSLLNAELKAAGLGTAQARTLGASFPAFRLAASSGSLTCPSLSQLTAPESYALDVRETEIVCAATNSAGLFYGLQTLRQLIRANRQGESLPCLSIRDWPSLRWRCFQDDMTRGPSSTLGTLKFEVSLGAFLKLNLMTFYMESQYAFKKHPKIGPPEGSLTPQDLSVLVVFAKPLGLDILGNQQSFGHFSQILKHPEYARMRETDNVLTPVREETYRLLDDLYSEVCPLLPFPWFNVCCDETDGLGAGPSRELAAKIGVGGVYVQHIRRVHDLLRDKHGKRMMMWGDIILQHPNNLQDIPKDTLMLTWGYDARASFDDQIVPFAKSGYEFFVCPGVNNWSRILPDFGVAATNIHHFVRDGVKHGALGMINTDWEDDGEAINAVKWHADAWAAECAWNASATPLEAFNRRAGAVLFGESGAHFGRAVALLAQTHRLPGMNGMMNARFWERDFAPKKSPSAIQITASNLLAVVRPAIQHLEACRREAQANVQVLDALLFGARRMEFMGQRMLDGLEAAQLYAKAFKASEPFQLLSQAEKLVRKNRDAYEAMGKQFEALWLSESKPYALDWTLRRYASAVEAQESLLGKLAAARTAAVAGKPLPDPEEIGLAVPGPISRSIRPRQTLPTALAPETAWADNSATHRLGVVVSAGADDRFDLPVELDLGLPRTLAGKPVRAFLMKPADMPKEVLAQIDFPGSPGANRLVFMLPGPLLKGQEASVHVYLGLTNNPAPQPGAANASPGSNGMVWIENDHVRLLWGSEGAHCYRWEVKAAHNRDLTMPGESGWAGFGDIGFKRQSQYRLSRTAKGPAMVEYQFVDADGHAKTVRLYGGTSWIEVFLNEPTPLYWNFDNPKNFAADGPTPGTWLFSNGQTGPVGREADGVPAQVKMPGCQWVVKYNANKLALGLATPGPATFLHVAPGGGAGGVGIENSTPATHFVTFAGVLEGSPSETMNRLQSTLDLKRPAEVQVYSLQPRPEKTE